MVFKYVNTFDSTVTKYVCDKLYKIHGITNISEEYLNTSVVHKET
jgi:hypothetical protein